MKSGAVCRRHETHQKLISVVPCHANLSETAVELCSRSRDRRRDRKSNFSDAEVAQKVSEHHGTVQYA